MSRLTLSSIDHFLTASTVGGVCAERIYTIYAAYGISTPITYAASAIAAACGFEATRQVAQILRERVAPKMASTTPSSNHDRRLRPPEPLGHE